MTWPLTHPQTTPSPYLATETARERPNDEAKRRNFERGSTHHHPHTHQHSLIFFHLFLDHSPIRACLVTHDVVEGLQDGVAVCVEIYAHDGEEEARVERERNRTCASLDCWELTELSAACTPSSVNKSVFSKILQLG